MNIFRRLPLNRLLLLCGLVLALGIGATAIASALDSGPTPPPKPLAQAIHDALGAPAVQGVSANIKLTNNLLEGASLAGAAGGAGGEGSSLSSSPLLNGGSGRLWLSSDGRARIELQAEKGDTQIYYDGHTLSVYDAASNTVYRYTPKSASAGRGKGWTSTSRHGPDASGKDEIPTVAKIEEAITKLRGHANISGATPTDVGGRAAYTVRVSPKEGGSLIGGAELSFDAGNGAPLRAAVYSSTSSAPVMELAASEVSYAPVPDSVFSFAPPAGAKVEELKLPDAAPNGAGKHASANGAKPTVTTHGHGPSAITVLESKAAGAKRGSSDPLQGLPKVQINGTSASELRTALGTLLSFERSGVRYVIAGSVAPSSIEAFARGL